MVRAGDIFGDWVVLDCRECSIAGTKQTTYGVLCRCSCGVERLVRPDALLKGRSTRCSWGCSAKPLKTEAWRRLYTVWWNMKRRCYDSGNSRYTNYGGRGIRVCRRWLRFRNFYSDMLPFWQKGLWLERRDTNGEYSPTNCYFTTQLRQANNKTNTKWLEVQGERMSLADAVRRYGVVPYDTVKRRISVFGYSVWYALTTPVIPQSRRTRRWR